MIDPKLIPTFDFALYEKLGRLAVSMSVFK
jgi:hypothetical protein